MSKIQPNDAKFKIELQTIDDFEMTGIMLFVMQISDPNNDDIREIDHLDFNKYWDNEMENVFSTLHFQTVDDARKWCISIGMTEDPNMEEVGG